MAEYIEREAGCKDCICYEMCAYVRANGDERVLKNSPCKHFKNKADVVEVVRCKDCKRWSPDGGYGLDLDGTKRMYGECAVTRFHHKENHFCSYGAKMDGRGDGE